MHLPLYLQGSCFEVQVVPFQSANFATAKAGGQLQQKQFVAAIFLGLNQQPLDFLRVSTCISLGFADGSLHPSEGLRKISFSSTA